MRPGDIGELVRQRHEVRDEQKKRESAMAPVGEALLDQPAMLNKIVDSIKLLPGYIFRADLGAGAANGYAEGLRLTSGAEPFTPLGVNIQVHGDLDSTGTDFKRVRSVVLHWTDPNYDPKTDPASVWTETILASELYNIDPDVEARLRGLEESVGSLASYFESTRQPA